MITATEALASAVALALKDVESRLARYGPTYAGSDPDFWTLTRQRETYQRALALAEGVAA